MMRKSIYSRRGNFLPAVAGIASIIVGFMALTQVFMTTYVAPTTSMNIEAAETYTTVGQTVAVHITVSSNIPVNAYTGIIEFDESMLAVEKITYNTSIATLWAKEPWYAKGSGKVTFTGGTATPGGFSGKGTLLTIYFTAQKVGTAAVHFTDAQVLQHDGIGSEAPLAPLLDTLFTITSSSTNALSSNRATTTIRVADTLSSTDMNNDGKTSISDMAIFMPLLGGTDIRGDFNADGSVTMRDFAILLEAF
jgi:hypothetical protein